MDLQGLEAIRVGLKMTPARFAKALVAASGQLVDKPLRDIELHEVAVIYNACAVVSGDWSLEREEADAVP